MTETVFFRLLAHGDKAAALADAVAAVREGRSGDSAVHAAHTQSFCQVPGSPFAYWVSDALRRKFVELPPFERDGRTVKQGLATADDFRFVRAWWEVAPHRILDGGEGPHADVPVFQRWCCQRTFQGKPWLPFAKGGEYSPYYSDVHLVVDWEDAGKGLRLFERAFIRNEGYYFRLGLTWSRRTQGGLSFRVLPAGCVFADKGPAAFGSPEDLPYLLSLSNSAAFRRLVALHMAFGSYEVGVIQRTPVPELARPQSEQLGALALASVNLSGAVDTANETSHAFRLPALLQVAGSTLANRLTAWEARVQEAEQALSWNQAEIDEIAYRLYGISDEDRKAIEESPPSGDDDAAAGVAEGDEVEEEEPKDAAQPVSSLDRQALVADLLCYAVGCAFGRWDVRLALDSSHAPKLQNPFDPLPVCSPGMLVAPGGLPAVSGRIVSEEWLRARPDAITLPAEGSVGRPTIPDAEHPLPVAWSGMLVDDPDHPDDVVRRLGGVLGLLWGEHAEAIEKEACAILGVKYLREYFRNPRWFFDGHVKRYSKSRRKAPIYWLLQSSRRSYGLWLYVHRLTPDTYFKALTDYVGPKLALETSRLDEMRADLEAKKDGLPRGERVQREKELAAQESLITELADFRDRLDRVARLGLAPDLDDGVVLSIAPLHELVPWPEARRRWDELVAGKHAWSTMAQRMQAKGLARRCALC